MTTSYSRIKSLVDSTPNDALPSPSALLRAASTIPSSLPATGLGDAATEAHLLTDLVPGFNGPKTSANYYGFVTGGTFPVAEFADCVVTAFDQNVQVHLPDQSVSTIVEDRALGMLVQLLDLGRGWEGKTFTTGATGANILGLACGREAVVSKRLEGLGELGGVGEMGLLTACLKAGIRKIQVLTAMGHSSLYKASSVVGLGRAAVRDIGSGVDHPWKMDLDLLQQELQQEKEGVVSIVVLSAGEVNTGRFSTDGFLEMQKIRDLCDKYGAWLHVDGGIASVP
jgi:glutamate/tyrosine decarboxylase-like PLP-dependent enzyme